MPGDPQAIKLAGLELAEWPQEGRCLTASQDFTAGSVLLTEKPLVRHSSNEAACDIAQDPRRFSLLRGSENLAAAHLPGEHQPFFVEAETNSFLFGGKCLLFHLFAMLNHACAGSKEENVCFSILNTGQEALDDGLEVKLVAVRDIRAGEALRISYHELFADPESKMARIQAHCAGSCRCSLCLLGEGRDVRQLHRLHSSPVACQQCSASSSVVHLGDLVALQGLPDHHYNGLHGRVLRVLDDGRCLVHVLFQGTLKQLRVKEQSLVSLERMPPDLRKCSQCKSVFFCSRECQRMGWKDHKPYCSTGQETWEADYQVFCRKRETAQMSPAARQRLPTGTGLDIFSAGERFVKKWTQCGRCPHLAPGHYAVQSTLLFLIPWGTLLLWRQSENGHFDSHLWCRVAELAAGHLQHVQTLVPRFHIAHWTALHHIRGLLSLARLQPETASESHAQTLARCLAQQLEVAQVFDPESAEDLQPGLGGGPLVDGMKLFQNFAKDSMRLEEFYSIDPSMPLEEKMERMAELLDPVKLEKTPRACGSMQGEPLYVEESAGESTGRQGQGASPVSPGESNLNDMD